jgi:hypothetical protein
MRPLLYVTLLASAALIGCSNRPSRIAAPSWDPDAQSSKALELYDKNQDGVIDQKELTEAPGLASAAWHLDKDGDKGVNKKELQDRLQLYKDLQTGLVSLSLKVTLNGRPLSDAEVVLTPEPYVADVIEPASGTTDRDGMVYPTSNTAEVPGIQPGFYRIEVKSPHIKKEKAMRAAKSYGIEASPVSDGENSSSMPIIRL